MQKIVVLLALLLSMLCTNAQQSLPCKFERLFTIKPGMQKDNVLMLLSKSHRLTQTDHSQKRILTPYAKNKTDSTTVEIIAYNIDSSECLQGRRQSLKIEFADNRLYKAYISADFKEEEQLILKDNFNFLRTELKMQWKYENAINFKEIYMRGAGYNFTNTRKKEIRPEYVALHYIINPTSKTLAPELQYKYTLEIIWANLKNTRMQRAYY